MTTTFDLDNAVRLAQRGDRDAFGELVTRYQNLVFSVALSVLRDAEAARDVTQGVFLTAWQKLRELRSPSSLPPWLRETARLQALHHLRGAINERARAAASPTPDAARDADVQLAEREEAVALGSALDGVPDDVREVLLLYYSEEQSIAQVAALLELSEDAVKKRLQRARASLREEYEQALGRKVKRVLPGAALVAAILAGLERPSHASHWPRVLAVGVAAAIVVGLVVAKVAGVRVVHAGGGSSGHVMGVPADVPTSTSLATSSKPIRGSAPVLGPASAHAGSAPAQPADCSLDMWAVQHRVLVATGLIEARATPEPAAPTGEVAEHLEAAYTAHYQHEAAFMRDMKAHRPNPEDPTRTLDPAGRAPVAWLIQHCSTGTIFRSNREVLPMLFGPADPEFSAMWLHEVDLHPGNARVLGNAAMFFSTTDDHARSRELLERAQALEPTNPEWSSDLGEYHASIAQTSQGDAKVDSAQNAVGYMESSLEHSASDWSRLQGLAASAHAAFDAKEDGLASQRATEVIALSQTMQDPSGFDVEHRAQILLGRIALRAGDVPEAERRLMLAAGVQSSPVLASFGPDFVLAQELLARGRRDAVLRYFDAVRPMWTFDQHRGCLADWSAKIKRGEMPKMEEKWRCAAP